MPSETLALYLDHAIVDHVQSVLLRDRFGFCYVCIALLPPTLLDRQAVPAESADKVAAFLALFGVKHRVPAFSASEVVFVKFDALEHLVDLSGVCPKVCLIPL